MFRLRLFVFLVPVCFAQHFTTDEPIYTINSLKALHTVSEKFISISIDPAVLLTGLNLSNSSIELAKGLSPSYIRIAGPSTQFVRYEESDELQHSAEDLNIVVTPSMWFGINEWLAGANLTPIFGINDFDRDEDGHWKPDSTKALLDLSDKLNLSCNWQLGYDCSNKTEVEYKADLKLFSNLIDEFPDKSKTWKIIGSDLSQCLSNNQPETVRRTVDDLQGTIKAVMWEHPSRQDLIRYRTPIWTIYPKENHEITFASALNWAVQLGAAAHSGYEVLFRQPRLHELFEDTPAYWVSILHKNLMGRTVLDVKQGSKSSLDVFANCAKGQNSFVRSGAVTVFLVNNNPENRTAVLKFGSGALMKNTEVQSYVVTAPNEDSTFVFVNDERITLLNITNSKLAINPKLRYARIMNYLTLHLPPKSLGFFVLPGIQLPVCQSKETELKELIAEIQQDQAIPFKNEDKIESRLASWKRPSLKELQKKMELELAADRRFYDRMKHYKKTTTVRPVFKAQRKLEEANEARKDVRNFFIERAHLAEKQRKQFDGGLRLAAPTPKPVVGGRELELELTTGEIKKILADRAKVKAAKKHVMFTSSELEEIMNKATEKILRNKNTSITIRRKTKRDVNVALLKTKEAGKRRKAILEKRQQERKQRKEGKKTRKTRDINLDLLKIKSELSEADKPKVRFGANEEKLATIRQEGEESHELVVEDKSKEAKSSTLPDGDIFAKLAVEPEEETLFSLSTTEKPKKVFKPSLFKSSLFPALKPIIPKVDLKLLKPVKVVKQVPEILPTARQDEFDQLVDEADQDFYDLEENIDGIHEFLPKDYEPTIKTKMSELFEASPEAQPKDNLPNFKPRLAQFKALHDLEEDFDLDYSASGNPMRRKREPKAQLMPQLKAKYEFRKRFDLMNKQRLQLASNSKHRSLSDSFKEWKAGDVLNRRNRVRKERGIDVKHIDTLENEIDGYVNEIAKEEEVVQMGDYQLIFPNSDRIEVVEKGGKTELKMEFNNGLNGTVEGRSNVQKIAKKKQANVFKKVFSSLTDFFKSLAKKMKHYFVDDLLN